MATGENGFVEKQNVPNMLLDATIPLHDLSDPRFVKRYASRGPTRQHQHMISQPHNVLEREPLDVRDHRHRWTAPSSGLTMTGGCTAQRELHDSHPSTWLYQSKAGPMQIRIVRPLRQRQQLLPTHRHYPRWQNTEETDATAGGQHP